MVTLSTQSLLLITSGAIGAALTIFFLKLKRTGLFQWTSVGFWAWTSFALYFVFAPVCAIFSGYLEHYEIRLGVSGGTARGMWLLLVAVIGIASFFIVYLRTSYRPVNWRLAWGRPIFTPPVVLVLTAFIFMGVYSLLAFRTGVLSYAGERLIEEGHFVGDVTGYEEFAHMFLFVPILLLLLSQSPLLKGLGWIAALGYCLLSLPHAWSRYITVSMVVALSIVHCLKARRAWPRVSIIAVIALMTMVFQIRGHVGWDLSSTFSEFTRLVPLILEHNVKIFGGSVDTIMLGTWYVESALKDTYTGYDYGLPLLNYALTGWIPYRFFPHKYFLINWLRAHQGTSYPAIYDALLYGAKPTLLGSFYNHGGLIAVIICMGFTGFLCRRLDGMLSPSSPEIVRAVGIAFFSVLWMVGGSHDTWGIVCLGTLAIPGVFVWLASRKGFRGRGVRAITGRPGSARPCRPTNI